MLAGKGSRRLLLACCGLVCAPGIALAADGEAVAPSLAAGLWEFSVDGFLREGDSEFRFGEDLQIEDDEHGFLVWTVRDFALMFSKSNFQGAGTVSEDSQFLAVSFTTDTDIFTTVELADLHLRWMPVSWKLLRFGGSVKWLHGNVFVSDGDEEGREEIEEVFPLVSVAARAPLGESFAFSADLDWIESNEDRAIEYRLELSWKPASWFFSAGWWDKQYRVSNDRILTDASINGPYLVLGRSF